MRKTPFFERGRVFYFAVKYSSNVEATCSEYDDFFL